MSTPEHAEIAPTALVRGLSSQLRAGRGRLLVAVGAGLVLAALLARPDLLAGGLGKGVAALSRANATFLWIAGAGFLVSLIASAATWRTTLAACGARLGMRDACARYGIGSLVNTFTPFRLGDAARVVLFSRTLRQDGGRVMTTGGAFGAIEAARALVQAVLVAVAVVAGALPLWPVVALGGSAAGGALLAFVARRRLRWRRVEHLLDAFRALARSPRQAASMLGWTAVAAAARVIAATAIASSLGVPWSPRTGLLITVALDLAGTIQLTPGNVGITSGAVALALQARGVPLTAAVASGLAFHAVEAATGLAFGGAGALLLMQPSAPGAYGRRLRLAGAVAALLVAAAIGTSIVPGVV